MNIGALVDRNLQCFSFINVFFQEVSCSFLWFPNKILFNVISFHFLFPRVWVFTFQHQNKMSTVFCSFRSERGNKLLADIFVVSSLYQKVTIFWAVGLSMR